MQFSNFSRPPCTFLIFLSREEPVQMFKLNLRQFLPKTVSRCQGNCGIKITQNDGVLIKAYGTAKWMDKKLGKEMSKYGPMYIHFNETCHGVVVITTAQLHSMKPELRFCAGSSPACGVSEIRDGEDL